MASLTFWRIDGATDTAVRDAESNLAGRENVARRTGTIEREIVARERFDAAVIFGLKALDVTGGSAVAFAVLVRFVLFAPITIAGLALLIGRYGGLRRLRGPRA